MATVRRLAKLERATEIAALKREGLFVVEWTDAPGVIYPEHRHPGREVRVVLSGALSVGAGDSTFELCAGDAIELEPGELHWARVGPEGATYLAGTTR